MPRFASEYELVLSDLVRDYSIDTVRSVLDAALNDSFWKSKLLEPKSLRRNFAKMKLDLIEKQKSLNDDLRRFGIRSNGVIPANDIQKIGEVANG